MSDPFSRYAGLPTATLTTASGRTVAYLTRRLVPPASSLPTLAEVAVQPGDRLDLIADRVYGDPLSWWLLADANEVLDPRALTTEVGRRLRVPVPQPPALPAGPPAGPAAG